MRLHYCAACSVRFNAVHLITVQRLLESSSSRHPSFSSLIHCLSGLRVTRPDAPPQKPFGVCPNTRIDDATTTYFDYKEKQATDSSVYNIQSESVARWCIQGNVISYFPRLPDARQSHIMTTLWERAIRFACCNELELPYPSLTNCSCTRTT